MPGTPQGHDSALARIDLLREEMIEHVMRTTDDDLLAAAFLDVAPGSHDYLVCLGRLLSRTGTTIPAGTPLHYYGNTTPSNPDVTWRDSLPSAERTLWSELQTLRALHGSTPAPDPMSELHALRLST